MTHAEAFLQDILAHPDDDTPRLIFADWLEEQGDPNSAARAEFIRVQCTLSKGQLPESRRAELEGRQQELLEQWGDEWIQPIRRWVLSWHFHRGFIDEIAMSGETFLASASRIFRRAPIQHLRLYDPADRRLRMPVLADIDYLRHLRSLDLIDNRLDSRDVRALLVSEYLTNLTSLSLAYNRIGDGGIRALAESPLLGHLTRLDLRHNDLGPSGVRALAKALEKMAHDAQGLPLRRVDLRGNNLGGAGQRVVAESPLLRRLVVCV